MQSMTGFGSREAEIKELGRVYVEIKSINHKSSEIISKLPEGMSWLEEKIKKVIEARLRRGRILCLMTLTGGKSKSVFTNTQLLKDYMSGLRRIRRYTHCKDEVTLGTLISLPGVVSLADNKALLRKKWPVLKKLVTEALASLIASRKREGGVLAAYLLARLRHLNALVDSIGRCFKKAVAAKLENFLSDEEKENFLKVSDISEELQRVAFHIRNFMRTLKGAGPKGKELDFIAQEMQREINTTGAKSFDVLITSRVIEAKSEIEKIREQLQNIE
ncbi:MAG: YicC family protein [Candidatus Omnitrophota bacterium]|nr:MAG: YicC family protein [Candidatus Omnitrophota bacterium]